MTNQTARTGYSADVELFLHVDGKSHSATHVCEDYVILVTPADLKPGPAMVEVIVDGNRYFSEISITSSDDERRQIYISGGSLSASPRIAS